MNAKQFVNEQINEYPDMLLKAKNDDTLIFYLDKDLFDADSHALNAGISLALYENGQARSFIAAKNTYDVITMSKFADLIKLAARIALKWQVHVEEEKLLETQPVSVPFIIEPLKNERPQCTINGCNGIAEHHTDYGHLCVADYLDYLDEGILE